MSRFTTHIDTSSSSAFSQFGGGSPVSYGAPFSHLFTELKISPIEASAHICNSIGDISNSIEDIYK